MRILAACELGGNFGHIAALLRIAKILRTHNHDVLFVLRDTAVASSLLSVEGFRFLQSPPCSFDGELSDSPASYAEILIKAGMGNPDKLHGVVLAWRTAIIDYGAQFVLADSAPSAVVAAKTLSIPHLAVGNGFAVPPPSTPWPSIKPWLKFPEDRLVTSELRLTRSIEHVVQSFRGETQFTLAMLYQPALLYGFPELDPFGPREASCYVGPILTSFAGSAETWSGVGKHKILVYLRPEIQGFPLLMDTLLSIDSEVICVIPGLSECIRSRYSGTRMRIFLRPIRLDSILSEANLVISYGGIGMVTQSLLAGIPMLLVPQFTEQYLTSRQVESLGAGIMIGPRRSGENFRLAVERLISNSSFRLSAREFAARHTNADPRRSIQKIVNVVESTV